ncbi:hypothetical protein E2C01_072443 [Portunus trituberculatus]|uniref:Uncharacterized protein n=1 Tax=Portunus trituberculatus TaxID=210409 RepID=A0A5B7I6P9_PORTR|nr:hypothetical protein [Portunus trituberculatus]
MVHMMLREAASWEAGSRVGRHGEDLRRWLGGREPFVSRYGRWKDRTHHCHALLNLIAFTTFLE